MAGNETDPELPCETGRGIVIQLMGTEGQWDSLDDGECRNLLSPPLEPKRSNSMTDKDDVWGLQSPAFHVPLSPSSPGSLASCSSSGLGFLSPSHRPLSSLVKSLSTELELKDGSSLKPRPLLSLVKSISTELSRSNPDLSQFKSDSKINLHLWSQLRQSKGHSGDSRTAPPFPVRQSLSEPKAGLIKAELEDTCRKLSEAKPFSVFGKIHRTTSSAESLGRGFNRSSGEPDVVESPMRSRKTEQRNGLPMCNWTVRPCRKCRPCKTGDDEVPKTMARTDNDTNKTCSSVPGMVLCCAAALLYCYLVLPLSSFWSGLFVGLAFGFLLGLLLIQLGSATKPYTGRPYRPGNANDWTQSEHALQGWLNLMFEYNPETYHPTLMHSVYATLDGSRLRLDFPRNSVPRRASFSEPNHDRTFTHSQTFRLDGSEVSLVPTALARKRVWNRKYPICITRAREEEFEKEALTNLDTVSDKPTFLTDSGPATNQTTTLYLFGRTGREKEEWFQQLHSATTYKKVDLPESSDTPVHREDTSGDISSSDPAGRARRCLVLDYTSYMTDLMFCSPPTKPCLIGTRDQIVCCHGRDTQPAWINALIGRLFWDFLREKDWAGHVANKIQRKLSKIRLPYFMDDLTVTELSMGSSMPHITDTFLPQVSARGLWIHLGIEYTGALQMTLETKINLSRLVKEGPEADETETCCVPSRSRLALLADSDEESSSAGSSDEDEAPSAKPQRNVGEKGTLTAAESTGRRILRFVDRIAKSKCVQKATENEFIKKKMEEMSNVPLLLTVEVKELSGMLAVNVPPPPTDRLWYGFCVPPKLDLRVRPKLGEREVTICHVTQWIEKKLQDEFQKVFVLPNMDDVYLPLMSALNSGETSPK